jgi:hypothetical protein
MLVLVTGLALFLYGAVLPGLLAVRLAMPSAAGFERIVIATALGLAVIPVLSFGAAILLRTIVTPALIAGVATLLDVVLGAALLFTQRRRAPAAGPPTP